ncbi:MAG: hypothetical protein GX033_08960 [Firmicutes bacterium]|nr:hypothetical protein [Bacillota bacterium]
MKKIEHLLLVLVLVGVIAASQQLSLKAAIEPLKRPVTLVVDAWQVEEFGDDRDRLWEGLLESGVGAVFIRSLDELPLLPPGVQVIAVVNEENWEEWKTNDYMPDGVVFSFNLFPDEISVIDARFPGIPFGLLEFVYTSSYANRADYVLGRARRVYDRQPRDTNRFYNEFAISVLERQVDLAVIRLMLEESADLNLSRAQQIQAAILADGHSIGPLPEPRPLFPQLGWALWGMAVALGAAVSLVAYYTFGSKLPTILYLVPPVGALAGVFLGRYLFSPTFLRQLLSLGAAVFYPTAGFAYWWRRVKDKPASSIGVVLLDFAILILCAVVGGLSVHAFLALPIFQLNLLQFKGVKLAYMLPLGFAALHIGYFVYRDVRQRPQKYWNKRRTRQIAVLGALAVAVAVFVLLNRSGNATLIPVPDWEMAFRDFLFQKLWARPRTKEFLGFPLLLIGIYLWRRDEPLYGGTLFLIGFIGVLSVVNTFEHLHHPIVLSLIRTGVGLGLGLVLGLIALMVVHFYFRLRWVGDE